MWYTLRGKSGFSCGKLYKKSLLNKFGIRFKEGCIQGEDADFNFELMKINPCVEYVDCIIYQYRFSSITAFHRWEKDADKMIYSSDARFRRNMEYMRANNIGSEAVYDLFLCARIRAIYQNAVDLCCVKRCTGQQT